MANSAEEANWSGSKLFAKEGISEFSRTRVYSSALFFQGGITVAVTFCFVFSVFIGVICNVVSCHSNLIQCYKYSMITIFSRYFRIDIMVMLILQSMWKNTLQKRLYESKNTNCPPARVRWVTSQKMKHRIWNFNDNPTCVLILFQH